MKKIAKAYHPNQQASSNQAETPASYRCSPEIQKTMVEIANAMAVPSNGPLTPDPRIRENALRRLRRPQHRPGILHLLKRPLFDFRIPVYQAMVGMALLFAVFFVTDRAFLSGPTQTLQVSGSSPDVGKLADSVTAAAPDDIQKVVKDTLLHHIGLIDTFLTGTVRDTL
ncbi:MAG: hypothetical protein O7G87_16655 [bacterium]|nr:hypothetical protein [bacterium]